MSDGTVVIGACKHEIAELIVSSVPIKMMNVQRNRPCTALYLAQSPTVSNQMAFQASETRAALPMGRMATARCFLLAELPESIACLGMGLIVCFLRCTTYLSSLFCYLRRVICGKRCTQSGLGPLSPFDATPFLSDTPDGFELCLIGLILASAVRLPGSARWDAMLDNPLMNIGLIAADYRADGITRESFDDIPLLKPVTVFEKIARELAHD